MTLPLSWDEWSSLDGVALADRVRAGELTAIKRAHTAERYARARRWLSLAKL
jgi:hypothetical protein